MSVLALGAVPPPGAPHVQPVDPVAEAAQRSAAVEALTALAARSRGVAAQVQDQVAAQRALLDVVWRGWAASAFTDAVTSGAVELAAVASALEQLADDAERRAHLVDGSVW